MSRNVCVFVICVCKYMKRKLHTREVIIFMFMFMSSNKFFNFVAHLHSSSVFIINFSCLIYAERYLLEIYLLIVNNKRFHLKSSLISTTA